MQSSVHAQYHLQASALVLHKHLTRLQQLQWQVKDAQLTLAGRLNTHSADEVATDFMPENGCLYTVEPD